jgi:tetratricopeptide (TPR) repeat protein
MLFDLRGRGRRRTIQGIYLGLAVLMGGGLVLFGVGGTGVGLFGNDNKGSSGGGGNAALKQLQAAERTAHLRPGDADAWGQVAYQRYLASRNDKKYYDPNGDPPGYTPAGQALLRSSGTAWDKYVSLNPKKPDQTVVNTMATAAFGPTGLSQPKKVVEAYELATQAQPHSYLPFQQLALAAYAAGQTRKAALAGEKAIELSPKDQRANTKLAIAQAKKAGTKAASGATSTTSPSG